MNPDQHTIRLNQYAQGILPMTDARSWYFALSADQRTSVLAKLGVMVGKAQPLDSEVHAAIAQAGLEPTFKPCVFMTRGPVRPHLAIVAALPDAEHDKSFALLLTLLGIADARRRRTDCASGCTHWWHQDLADEAVVQRCRDASDPVKILRPWTDTIAGVLAAPDGTKALATVVTFLLETTEGATDELRTFFLELGPQAEEAYMTAANDLRAEGRVQGQAELLLKQLKRRFGPVPRAARDRVQAGRLEQLEIWGERIFDASTLDEVFPR